LLTLPLAGARASRANSEVPRDDEVIYAHLSDVLLYGVLPNLFFGSWNRNSGKQEGHVPEVLAFVDKDIRTGMIQARIIRARERAFNDQLRALSPESLAHLRELIPRPYVSLPVSSDPVLSQLRFEKLSIDDKACPVLRSLVAEFPAAVLAVKLEAGGFGFSDIGPEIYFLHVQGADASADVRASPPHPAAAWAAAALREVQKCLPPPGS
jgi:hypothetical protein